MRREGCDPGTLRIGDKCILPEFPKVGSGSIPSIENQAGCKAINGSWDAEYNICVKKDEGASGGYTAPVKGAIIAWFLDITGSGPDSWDAEIIGCHPVHHSKFKTFSNFEEQAMGCRSFHSWMPDWTQLVGERGSPLAFEGTVRNTALDVASAIKHGRADIYGLSYYDSTGREVSPDNRNAIVADHPDNAIEAAKTFQGDIEPFKIKSTPAPISRRTIQKARDFAKYLHENKHQMPELLQGLPSYKAVKELVRGLEYIGEDKIADNIKQDLGRVTNKTKSSGWWE